MPFLKFSVVALAASLVFSPLKAEPVVRTLKDAYQHALETSERIAVSEQAIKEAEGLYRQAFGSSFPELTFQHNTLWQDRKGIPARNSVPESPQSNGMFRLSKTGLTGYREIYAVKAGGSFIKQREFERLRINQLLFSDVATAFFGLLQAGENVGSTDKLVGFADKRLKELRDRVRVGRTRDADAIEQEFQITGLSSQLEELNRLVGERSDLLSFLVGAPVMLQDLQAAEVPLEVNSLESYLSRMHTRPDVHAAQAAVNVAKGALEISRGNHFPSIDLVGNYYSYRPDSREGVDWDAGLNVGVPIFSWWAIQGQVMASRAVLRQTEEILSAARRLADLEIRNAYRDFLSARHQMELTDKATKLAQRGYELQMRDDRRSLVTSLEVLEALNRLNVAQLSNNTGRLNVRLARINLELAAGAAPEDILK